MPSILRLPLDASKIPHYAPPSSVGDADVETPLLLTDDPMHHILLVSLLRAGHTFAGIRTDCRKAMPSILSLPFDASKILPLAFPFHIEDAGVETSLAQTADSMHHILLVILLRADHIFAPTENDCQKASMPILKLPLDGPRTPHYVPPLPVGDAGVEIQLIEVFGGLRVVISI